MTLREKQILLRRVNGVAVGLCGLGFLTVLVLFLADARWEAVVGAIVVTVTLLLISELLRWLSTRALLNWRRAPRAYRKRVAERRFWLGPLGGLITILELTESDAPLDGSPTSPTSPSSPRGTAL